MQNRAFNRYWAAAKSNLTHLSQSIAFFADIFHQLVAKSLFKKRRLHSTACKVLTLNAGAQNPCRVQQVLFLLSNFGLWIPVSGIFQKEKKGKQMLLYDLFHAAVDPNKNFVFTKHALDCFLYKFSWQHFPRAAELWYQARLPSHHQSQAGGLTFSSLIDWFW